MNYITYLTNIELSKFYIDRTVFFKPEFELIYVVPQLKGVASVAYGCYSTGGVASYELNAILTDRDGNERRYNLTGIIRAIDKNAVIPLRF
jgi:hypothetical protein